MNDSSKIVLGVFGVIIWYLLVYAMAYIVIAGTFALLVAVIAIVFGLVTYLVGIGKVIHNRNWQGLFNLVIAPLLGVAAIVLARVLIDAGVILELANYVEHSWFSSGNVENNPLLGVLGLLLMLALIFFIFLTPFFAAFYMVDPILNEKEYEDGIGGVTFLTYILWPLWGFVVSWAWNYPGQ